MEFDLIVVHEFGAYVRGNRITDQDEVARILASNVSPNIVKVPRAPQAPAASGDDA